jgi:hypothetical protein
MSLATWLRGLFTEQPIFKKGVKELFPMASGSAFEHLRAVLDSPRVTHQCIAALTHDNTGVVLIRESLVKEYLIRKGTDAKATVIALAAHLGPMAYSRVGKKEVVREVAHHLAEKETKVKRLKSAHEVMSGLSDEWDVHVWMVTFTQPLTAAPTGSGGAAAVPGPKSLEDGPLPRP